MSQVYAFYKTIPNSVFHVSKCPSSPVPQPCQTIYQVFHDAVTRLIQYGVLYVAEVSLHNLFWTGFMHRREKVVVCYSQVKYVSFSLSLLYWQ